MPIFQVRKPRKTEDMQLSQGHTTSRGQGQDSVQLPDWASLLLTMMMRGGGQEEQGPHISVWQGAAGLEECCVPAGKVVCRRLHLSLHSFTYD